MSSDAAALRTLIDHLVREGCESGSCGVCEQNQQAVAVLREAVADAARWRALHGAARLHYMGSAGFELNPLPGVPVTKERALANLVPIADLARCGYLHFGMEFWSRYTRNNLPVDPGASRFERDMLLAFADAVIAQQAEEDMVNAQHA